jgi:uncharacterized protein (DUF1697 family)
MTTRYVAILRAINLGSHNRISMKDLQKLFDDLGHTDVTTYVQSGNVVFSASSASAAKVTAGIEGAIKKELGLDVTVLVRKKGELAKVVKANPFLRERKDEATLHVTFLATAPDAAHRRAVEGFDAGADEFHVTQREVYLWCPNGYGRSKLNNAFWEKKLAVPATTRNWKTTKALLDLAKG